MIGAPVLHAAHAGTLEGKIAITPGIHVATKTRLMGETQIVDASGTILARLNIDEGPGMITADVELGSVPHSAEPAQDFWSCDLPLMFRLFWSQQNAATRPLYAKAKASGLLRSYDFQSNA